MTGPLRFSGSGSLTLVGILVFGILIIIFIPLLILGLAGAAFSRLGLSWITAVAAITLMIFGYFVNIPVWTVRNPGSSVGYREAAVFDAFSGEPVETGQQSTVIAVNLGGFVIPVVISVYLLYQTLRVGGETFFQPLSICFIIVTLIVAVLTRIQPPSLTRVPLIIPALTAIASAVLLSGGMGLEAAVSAFVGGTMGILLGASAILLIKGRKAGFRLISIGGSGMFGPMLLCALLSTLIA